MTQDSSLLWIILAICGLATVLIGIAVFLFVAIMRFSGRGALGFMNFLAGSAGKDKPEVGRSEGPLTPPPDLRGLAQSADFDRALRDHGVGAGAQAAPPGTPPGTLPPAQPHTPWLDSSPRTDGPSYRPRERGEDDLPGAFLDQ